MILIAHRGNTSGPSKSENDPHLIEDVLMRGYDAEIDVWHICGEFWLGHDAPTYKIKPAFLKTDRLWCHAKNFEALQALRELSIPNYFWHDTDSYALTSSGFIWTYPGCQLSERSIAVMPETTNRDISKITGIAGICSDFVAELTCEN